MYRDLGEAGSRCVLDQVQWDDDGPWIPGPAAAPSRRYRDGCTADHGARLRAAEVPLAVVADEEAPLAAGLAAASRTSPPPRPAGLLRRAGRHARARWRWGRPHATVDRLVDLATPDG